MAAANDKRSFRISATDLAEFCCRRGDLNLGLERTPSAQDGQRGQRLLQSGKPAHYQKEVSVSCEFGSEHFQCILSGRIDGLLPLLAPILDTQNTAEKNHTDAPPALTQIEEIKTTYCTQAKLPASQQAVHLAQLKLYGALYLQQHPDESALELQLNYCNLEDESRFGFHSISTRAELENFFTDCIHKYSDWLNLHCQHLNRRDEFLHTLAFPFRQFRPGQRALSVQVYRDLRDQTPALYQAATGLGKTAGILYPAFKLLGENRFRQIFYVTAKTSGQRSVLQALQQIAQAEHNTRMPLRLLFLVARERQCFCDGATTTPCDWQTGFHDRLTAARLHFQQQSHWSSDDLLQLAQQFRLCPHALSRHLLPWVDLVVCDFNYVFDPNARLHDYLDANEKHIALLVDEAHNLPERARDMFSAQLQQSQLQSAAKQMKKGAPKKHLKQLLQFFPTANATPTAQPQLPEALATTVTLLAEEWLDWFAQQQWLVFPDEMFETLMACVRFARRAQQWQAEDRLITRSDPVPTLEIFCTDPAPRTGNISRQFHSSAFFSGSLLPLEYFARALSDEPFASQLNLPSPFPPQHQCTLIVPINTRFDARAHSVAPIAELITTVWNTRPGRYLVSFPSYPYLQDVLHYLQQHHADLPLLAQTSGTQGNDIFLETLQQSEYLALVIAGGSFAEGLDLQDNKLHGVIIVGTCMPPPSLQRELIREQADAHRHNGFDFAYRYPGLNRVIQTAGRVIRSETDRGLVILADDRFSRADTRRLLPGHWQPRVIAHLKDLPGPLQEFWSAPV